MMNRYAPDYFFEFACIKGDCRHSCCIGWEIDIDADSLAYYQSVPGELGRQLRENISMEGDAHFRLRDNERCPFLNGEGLCDLIIGLGPEALCQICDDHPRFRNYISDREEIGLGLCCEAAGRLILTHREAVQLIQLEDDGAGELVDPDEEALLALRDRLIRLFQDRSKSIDNRLRSLLEAAELPDFQPDPGHWCGFLAGLEHMDPAWPGLLHSLRAEQLRTLPGFDVPFEQLMVYLLYRHLSGATEDGDLQGRIAYCVLIWQLLRSLLALTKVPEMDDLIELCRLYSSEIEYSDENIGAILDEIHIRAEI